MHTKSIEGWMGIKLRQKKSNLSWVQDAKRLR
jgi:hypothetical protein